MSLDLHLADARQDVVVVGDFFDRVLEGHGTSFRWGIILEERTNASGSGGIRTPNAQRDVIYSHVQPTVSASDPKNLAPTAEAG